MTEPVYQASTLALLRHFQKHGPMTVHQVEQLKTHSTTSAASRVANLLKRGSVARVGRSVPARYEITGTRQATTIESTQYRDFGKLWKPDNKSKNRGLTAQKLRTLDAVVISNRLAISL